MRLHHESRGQPRPRWISLSIGVIFTILWSQRASAQCQTWSYEPQFQSGVIVGGGGPLLSCAALDDGTAPKLWVGGENFFTTNGVQHVGRWDGQQWIPTGALRGLDPQVHALAAYDDGSGPTMYAGGSFTLAGAGCRIAPKRRTPGGCQC